MDQARIVPIRLTLVPSHKEPTMKTALSWTIAFFVFLLALTIIDPVFANGVWEDDPPVKEEPQPETPDPETPAPEPTPETKITETDSWADRNSNRPVSRPLPCCILNGELVLKPTLFMSDKRALKICTDAKAKGNALIYECPGAVSPEAVK